MNPNYLKLPTKIFSGASTLILLAAALPFCIAAGQADEPFKLNAEQKQYLDQSSSYSYPAPQMVNTQPIQGRPIHSAAVHTNAAPPPQNPPPQRRPISAQVQTSVVLPPQFLGVWNVQGQRVKVEAMPEFQQGAEQAFAMNNSQVWTINGSPNNGYSLGSNTGVETQLIVDKVQGTTAFIRYQHPVGKTMAQEAIVMSLVPGGAQFNGLERISIVKQGLPQPRAKVTYQLVGHRQ